LVRGKRVKKLGFLGLAFCFDPPWRPVGPDNSLLGFRPDCRELRDLVVARDIWFMMSVGFIVVAAVAAIVFFISLRYPY
jgi:hypothetical protein